MLSPLFPHDSVAIQERWAVILSRMINFGLDCAWFGGTWDEDAALVVKRAALAALGAEIAAARVASGTLKR